MVHPQAYQPNYDIVEIAPFDDPSKFDGVLNAIGELPPGNFLMKVPDDEGTRLGGVSLMRTGLQCAGKREDHAAS